MYSKKIRRITQRHTLYDYFYSLCWFCVDVGVDVVVDFEVDVFIDVVGFDVGVDVVVDFGVDVVIDVVIVDVGISWLHGDIGGVIVGGAVTSWLLSVRY